MATTCRHVQQLRDAYLDGELSPSMTAEVHAHLLQCPACQREVEMIRVAGDVVAEDRCEPVPSAGFADRVVAALPGLSSGKQAVLPTRRVRRRHNWRRALGAALPAAAAIAFFMVVSWPATETNSRLTLVKGKAVEAIRASDVVEPTLGMFEDARRATQSVNRMLEISMDEAHRTVRRGLDQVKNPTLLDVFLQPFVGLLEPDAPSSAGAAEDEVVRF